MLNFKHFIACAILALSYLVIASPVQPLQKRGFPDDNHLQLWNSYRRGSNKHPIARIHKIPSDDILDYNGTPVLAARPLQPRFLIDGIDDRKKLVSKDYPFNVIRKIWLGNNMCTGTAVGPRHLITARHCIPSQPAPIKLKSKNRRYPVSYVTDIVVVQPRATECMVAHDFAVLVFDKPIFEADGYFGAKHYDFRNNFEPIFDHAGHPRISGKVHRIRQDNIQVTSHQWCDRALQIATDTDVDNGQSGGPLYKMEDGYGVLIGVLSGFREPLGGIYTAGMHVVGSIAYARDNFP